MFKIFDNNTFEALSKQWNIFVLVGNGFDISVLTQFKSGKMAGKTSSYPDFYDYISYFNLPKKDNILYKMMQEDKVKGKKNWSDFENTIRELLDSSMDKNFKELENSVDEFQSYFTKFLNDLVDADILLKLNEEVRKNKLSIQSLGEFLKDLDDLNNLKLIKKLSHYQLFNFVFANFNYTSLLDNYIFLDKSQFDPHVYKTIDTNFEFKFKLPGLNETNYSSYIILDTIHPHGVQDTPRSILFGTDLEQYDKSKNKEKRFVKAYWSQYDAKYKSYLEGADLFIIYGMSLGLSDAWWMDAIYDEIIKRKVELIIYKFGKYEKDEVINNFMNGCIRHRDSSEEEKKEVKNNIHVVVFNSNDTYFLGFKKK
ncbi:bacteriophage abortive infection protein AbiH [Peptostreptococcaceae bacterium AS15]|nr:bacteriophage abortive infection protein AbiH [Peptostreptococcaceae bacterium AS15]